MDNITLARLLDETAALLEIDAADPFRVRSYRRAAEAVEQQTVNLAALAESDPKALLAIPGIDALDEAARRGDLITLPRMGQRFTDKLIKGIEDHRKNASRFRIDVAQ